MKYRRLHRDELEELEKPFIQFLVANTITAEDWQKIKTEDPEKADKLIDIFSDIAIDKMMSDVNYLQWCSATEIRCFYCDQELIFQMGMRMEGSSSIDFKDQTDPKILMDSLRQTGAELKLFSAQKKYSKERGIELFHMIENGCRISDGTLYNTLKELK